MGRGFQFDHPMLEIHVNDLVQWEWKAPAHYKNAVYGVYEVANEYSEFTGEGINSGAQSAEGELHDNFIKTVYDIIQ